MPGPLETLPALQKNPASCLGFVRAQGIRGWSEASLNFKFLFLNRQGPTGPFVDVSRGANVLPLLQLTHLRFGLHGEGFRDEFRSSRPSLTGGALLHKRYKFLAHEYQSFSFSNLLLKEVFFLQPARLSWHIQNALNRKHAMAGSATRNIKAEPPNSLGNSAVVNKASDFIGKNLKQATYLCKHYYYELNSFKSQP